MARSGSFAADSVAAVNDSRLRRGKIELDLECLGDRMEHLARCADLNLPVAIPDDPRLLINAGNAGPRSVQALVVIEALPADIAQRQMRHIQIINVPWRIARFARCGLAEESQLEAIAV